MELDGTIIGKFGRAGKAAGRIRDDPSDGLPRSERHLHRRDQRLALAEDSAEAAGREVDRELGDAACHEHNEHSWRVRQRRSWRSAHRSRRNRVPDIPFDAADLLKTPLDTYVGEVGGVGQNSKGQIFVYTRTGHPYATIGDNRTFARGGSRLLPVRQDRQVRA